LKRCFNCVKPTIRTARSSLIRTNLHPALGSTAMAGTTETPMPVATMETIVENWPLSKMTFGLTRGLRQAKGAFSRKQ
jgi:hypothetical protein